MYFAAERGRNGNKRKLCNNTWVHIIDPDTVAVRYHYTDICTYHRSGQVDISTDGWWTPTTRERLNAFSPYYVWSYQNEWFISETYASNRDDEGKDAYPMYGHMRFLPDRRKNPQQCDSGVWVPVPSLYTLGQRRRRERERAARREAKERDKRRKARKMGNWLMRHDLVEYAIQHWLDDPSTGWKAAIRSGVYDEIEQAILKNPDKLRDDLKRGLFENLPTYVREKIIQAYQKGLTNISLTGDEIEKRVIEIEVYDGSKETPARGPLSEAVGGAESEGGSREGTPGKAGFSQPCLPFV